MMKQLSQIIVFTLLSATCGFFSLLHAEEVAVIVNQQNSQTLSESQINAIYTDQLRAWKNGERIKVYQLPVSDSAREVFSQQIMGKSARRVAQENANRKITNSFENPPLTKSAKLVLIYVRRDRNAIGYVPAEMARERNGIRVLAVLK